MGFGPRWAGVRGQGVWRVADRLLVDLGVDGLVTVGTWPEGGLPETVSRERLQWPLDEDALEDLRWYLEDYLRAPFGVWEDRGPQIQGRLAGWGEAVFASVFGSGPARDAYQRARDRELELVFRSASPGLLGLPSELMRDPGGPVALGLAGVIRALPVADLAGTAAIPGVGRLALSGQLYLRYFMLRAAGSGTRRGLLAESCNRVPSGDACNYSGSRCTGQCPPVLSFASGTRSGAPARPSPPR